MSIELNADLALQRHLLWTVAQIGPREETSGGRIRETTRTRLHRYRHLGRLSAPLWRLLSALNTAQRSDFELRGQRVVAFYASALAYCMIHRPHTVGRGLSHEVEWWVRYGKCRQPENMVAIGIYAIAWPFLFVDLQGGIGVDYQRQLIALAPFIALAWFGARRHDATDQADRRVRTRDRLSRRSWPQLPADVRASAQGAPRGGR